MKRIFKSKFPKFHSFFRDEFIRLKSIINIFNINFRIAQRERRHKKRIAIIKKKLILHQKINVIFLVNSIDMWKYDSLYRLFEKDTKYHPVIVFAFEKWLVDKSIINNTILFFSSNYRSFIFDSIDNTLNMQKLFKRYLKPDIVITPRPYELSAKQFKATRLSDLLTISCSYAYNVTNNKISVLNLHNAQLWKFYLESQHHLELYESYLYELGIKPFNFCELGYIGSDSIHNNKNKIRKSEKLFVIWAPHWTINQKIKWNFATFLNFSEAFLELAREFVDEIEFGMKPHPLLKTMLAQEEFWGEDKTESYFNSWESMTNTQVISSDYQKFFNISDALIHDSGSFAVEYLYTGKPAGYLKNEHFNNSYYNLLGLEALKVHSILETKEDVRLFLIDLINGHDTKHSSRLEFYSKYLEKKHGFTGISIKNDIEKTIGI